MPGDRTTFRRAIPADPLSVRAALADLGTSLTRLGIASDHIETLELVVAEILNNIVEHAYRDMDPGPIDIGVEALGGAIQCAVSDSGYGWFLIRGLAQDLTYTRIGDRNVLRFRIDFPSSCAES